MDRATKAAYNRRILDALMKIAENGAISAPDRLEAIKIIALMPEIPDEPTKPIETPIEQADARRFQRGPGYLPVWLNGQRWYDNRNSCDDKALFLTAKSAVENTTTSYDTRPGSTCSLGIAYVPPGKTVGDVLNWLNTK